MSENYQGIKYNLELTEKKISNYRIDDLIKWCKIFDEKKLAPPYEGGSYGNLSFRIKNFEMPFIITGTSIGLKSALTYDKFVKVNDFNFEKKTIFAEGLRKPSSESMLHFSIYKNRPEINAIFHGHSELILNNAQKLYIIETEKEEPYGSIELVNSVLKIIDYKKNFFILLNHGFFALGRNMHEAGNLTLKMLEKL
jgi:ribulose-5-phosphate 4-epimerase/fuculose-1-phosphate aldolase